MPTTRISTTRNAAIAAGALAVALSVTGCTPASPVAAQSVSVTYTDADSSSTSTITVGGLRCAEAQGLRTFIGGEDIDGRAAVTVSILEDQATVAIHLDGDRWFVSSGPTKSDDTSVTFDAVKGSVVEQGADLTILGIVDDTATLSGTLDCG